MSPAQLSASGWPDLVHGCIVSPTEDTYISGDDHSCMDYFVVHWLLAEDSSCEVRPSAAIANHEPVVLALAGSLKTRLTPVIRRPPKSPVPLALGCDPELL
eukprot:6165734-Pyramimonas_sp.AAC.1